MLNIKKINYDENYECGCETCDYGSSYISEIEIILEDGNYINIKVDKMYDYALSESDYMKLLSNSESIDEFCINIIKLIRDKRYDKDISFVIQLENLNITINGQELKILETLKTNSLKKTED